MEPVRASGVCDVEASFRDPGGAVFRWEDRIFRAVNTLGAAELTAFLSAPSGKQSIQRRQVVGTRVMSETETRSLLDNADVHSVLDAVVSEMILEHERTLRGAIKGSHFRCVYSGPQAPEGPVGHTTTLAATRLSERQKVEFVSCPTGFST